MILQYNTIENALVLYIRSFTSSSIQKVFVASHTWMTCHISDSFINLMFFFRKFLETLDDQEWQSSLFTLLQNQTFNQVKLDEFYWWSKKLNRYWTFQVEVDLFELMCKVLDQNLFAQVDWARNSFYFKELKVGIDTSWNQITWFQERL